MAADIEIVYKPGIKYTNISGSDLRVYEGPSSIYKDTGAVFKNNDSMTVTRVKGDYAYIPSIGGWVCIQKNGNHYAKMYDPNWKGRVDQYLTDYTSAGDNKEIEMTESTLMQSDITMSEAEKARAEAQKRSEEEKTSYDYTNGNRVDEIPYQSWTNPNWVPQDELYGDNNSGWPDTFNGQARESMQELQRISQQDFIIQPNLRKEKRFGMFDRVGILDPTAKIISTKEYVFFTKPDLNIFKNSQGTALNDGRDPVTGEYLYDGLANIPIFRDAFVRYKDVLAQLQSSVHLDNYIYNSPFMNILSNNIKSPIDLPAISAEETATSANVYGTAITYRDSSEKSDDGYEFNIEFEDTKYLEIYMLFKLYDEYERKKKLGIVGPKEEYIVNKIIHDQFSIYKLLVAEDGESIIYFAKFYGVYPKGVPRDVMNEVGSDGKVRFTVPFKCQFMDDQDPQILADFNALTNPTGEYSKEMSMPAMDPETQMGNIRFGMVPFITQEKINEDKADVWERVNRYKLRWIEDIRDTSQHRYFNPASYINESIALTRQELQSQIDQDEIFRGHIDDVNNILKRAAGQLIIDQDSVSKFWDLAHSAIVAGLPFTGR